MGGTTAVYPKTQYPQVDPSFYFTNAITLGQQVKVNTLPSIRVQLSNSLPPHDPPQPPRRAPYMQRVAGAMAFYRLKWVDSQEGLFDAKVDHRECNKGASGYLQSMRDDAGILDGAP